MQCQMICHRIIGSHKTNFSKSCKIWPIKFTIFWVEDISSRRGIVYIPLRIQLSYQSGGICLKYGMLNRVILTYNGHLKAEVVYSTTVRSTVHRVALQFGSDEFGITALYCHFLWQTDMDFTVRKKRGVLDDALSRRRREDKSIQIRKDKRNDTANSQRRRVPWVDLVFFKRRLKARNLLPNC